MSLKYPCLCQSSLNSVNKVKTMDKQSGELDRHMIQSLKSYLSKKILMAKQNRTNEKKIINQVACWRHKKNSENTSRQKYMNGLTLQT